MSDQLQIYGIKTKVQVVGKPDGQPLLFLHGWGCTGDTMKPILPAFQDSFRCILVDFPGFGGSDVPPQAWSVGDYTDFTVKLIEELGIGGCDVIAHSFGGRVMLKLMAREDGSKLVGKVLITGGAGMKPRRSAGYYRRLYTTKLLKAPFYLLPGQLREKGLNRLRQTAMWKKMGSSDYKTLDGVMREVFVKTVSEFLEDTLPKIENDVLLLWGETDSATPLYQAERMEKGIKKAALVKISGAGHYAFLDQPGRFRAIAKAFFEG